MKSYCFQCGTPLRFDVWFFCSYHCLRMMKRWIEIAIAKGLPSGEKHSVLPNPNYLCSAFCKCHLLPKEVPTDEDEEHTPSPHRSNTTRDLGEKP